MLASRLIQRSRRQRRLVARLVARHALLRRTTIGARMARVLAEASYEQALSAVPIWLPDADIPMYERPAELELLDPTIFETIEPDTLAVSLPAEAADSDEAPAPAVHPPLPVPKEPQPRAQPPAGAISARQAAQPVEHAPTTTPAPSGATAIASVPPALGATVPEASRHTPQANSVALANAGLEEPGVPPSGTPDRDAAVSPLPDRVEVIQASAPELPSVPELLDSERTATPASGAPEQSAVWQSDNQVAMSAPPAEIRRPRRPQPGVQPQASDANALTDGGLPSTDATMAKEPAQNADQPAPIDGTVREAEPVDQPLPEPAAPITPVADALPGPGAAAAQSAPPPSDASAPRQERLSRRARFEELGMRGAPAPARPAGDAAVAEKRLTASDIFSRDRPERDVLDWGRLLFEALNAPSASTPPASTPPIEPRSRPTLPADVRSVATLARQQREPGQPGATQPPPEQPAQLSETTRRFLRPLVGIEPESARVYRGTLADRVASSHVADAATAGDAIFLAAGNHDETAPETLGLLAHELTHIARRRTPRFVPPVVQSHVAEAADEEGVAREVESQTITIARSAHPAYSAPNAPSEPAQSQPVSPPPDRSPVNPSTSWGGLPAPWEPLPAWITASAGAPSAAEAIAPPPVPVGAAVPVAPSSVSAESASTAPALQLAQRDRSLDGGPPAHAPEGAPAAAAAVPPDLDVLARQVYAVLKQRLAAERRRLG